MAVKHFYTASSRQDINEAYDWYENRRVGLGEELLSCIDAAVAAICRSPHLHAIVYNDCRRAAIRRFPYSIFYRVSERGVTVLCVLHNSRNPKKWRERLSDQAD